MKPELFPQPFKVSKLVGDSILDICVYGGCTVLINDRPRSTYLIEFIRLDFEVILGLDWLVACYTNIDCRAKIVRFYFPWQNYTHKETKFKWTEACKQSFQELNTRVTTAHILTLLDGNKCYVFYRDASIIGSGCVLMEHGKINS